MPIVYAQRETNKELRIIKRLEELIVENEKIISDSTYL